MANSFSDIGKQFQAIIKTISIGKLITLAILVVSTFAGIFVLVNWSGKPEYMPLYTHLSAEDAGEVVAKLREQKVPYTLSHNGGTVQVPRERVYDLRLELAGQGLPRGSGVGFEVFDQTKLGATDFVQNINYQRALQGELSRTISGLAEVESARVHIVMAPRSLFIEEEEPASASVILKLRSGRWLNQDQIQGIVHLVSSSVPRLMPQQVTVVDNNGNLLAGREDEPSAAKLSAEHLDLQQRQEKLIEKRVLSMLEKVLGQDKVIVRVACQLDLVQQEKTEEMYLPENQVVRSEQLLIESSAQKQPQPQGIPGLASNIVPNNAGASTAIQGSGFQKDEKTRNYEIGKTTSRQILPVGKIERLSVAVVVDGHYETVTVEKGEEQVQETKYVARSSEEMSTLENIVKRAVNYDEARGDKVEVANIAFSTEKFDDQTNVQGVRGWLENLKAYGAVFKYLAAGLFLLLAFMFVIRPLIRWLTDTPWEDVELLEHLPRTLAELEDQYSGKDQINYVNQAAQLIAANQDSTSRLMKQWLKES